MLPTSTTWQKAKLRGQALDWLKAELAALSKLLDSGPPQASPCIVRALNHWQKETELAGLRDKQGLAKLPAREQKAFTQLWADVAGLRALAPSACALSMGPKCPKPCSKPERHSLTTWWAPRRRT
jgi:hypothetical protein